MTSRSTPRFAFARSSERCNEEAEPATTSTFPRSRRPLTSRDGRQVGFLPAPRGPLLHRVVPSLASATAAPMRVRENERGVKGGGWPHHHDNLPQLTTAPHVPRRQKRRLPAGPARSPPTPGSALGPARNRRQGCHPVPLCRRCCPWNQ